MCAAYLLCRRWAPRYAVLVVMGVAVAVAATQPHPDRPAESAPDRIRLDHAGLQRAGRHQPGHSAVRGGHGLAEPAGSGHPAGLRLSSARVAPGRRHRRPGAAGAPFGAHSVTLGAISAAICTGPEAHPDPSKRYIAAATYGLSYFALSIVAGAVAVFFQALPALLPRWRAWRCWAPSWAAWLRHGQSGAARGRADHAAGNRLGLQFLGYRFGLLGPGGGPAGTHPEKG